MKIPAARPALEKEWNALEKIRCWDLDSVEEYDAVRNNATRDGRTVHFGRVFALSTLKGSELPEGDPGRRYKGRVVFQGNNVTDQGSNNASFMEMSSSASLMIAGKFLDSIAMMEGNSGMQADGQQAYAQSELGVRETWIFLPKDRWPPSWVGRKNPVCRLRLALYGHPLSGAFWEERCKKQLLSVGFLSIPGWECCFLHRSLGVVLSLRVC